MNIGLGLGLQGTPDMHLGMVKSRQAAKDRYDAAQQKKQGEQINRFYQDFTRSMDDKRYLPVDEKRIFEASSAWYDFIKTQVESGNPDMNAISEMTFRVKNEAAKANAQREMYDKIATSAKEVGVFGEDLKILQSESDPDKLEEAAKNSSGSWQYNKQTGEVIWDLIPKYTPVSDQMQQFVKDNGKYIFVATEMPSEAYNVNKTSVRNIEINPAAKNLFVENATSGENLRSTLRDYAADPSNRGKARPDPSTEEGMLELQNYAGRSFDIAAESLLKQEKFRQGGGIKVNVFNNDQQEGVDLVLSEPQRNNIYEGAVVKDGKGGLISFTATSQGGVVLPQQEYTTAVPANTFNTKTRTRIQSSRGTIRGGKISIYPVAKKSVKGKVDGVDVTITAGEVIPNELLPIVAKASGIEYKKMVEGEFKATGTSAWVPVMYPATKEVESLAFQKSNKDKAQMLDGMVKELNDMVAGLQGLSEQQQAELVNNYQGDFITNIQEIREQYIDPNRGNSNKPTEQPTGSKTPTYGNQAAPKIKTGQTYSKGDVDKLSGGEHWSKKFKLVNGKYIAK